MIIDHFQMFNVIREFDAFRGISHKAFGKLYLAKVIKGLTLLNIYI